MKPPNTQNPVPESHPPRLTRDLGLFSIVMLGLGAMIGAGVFMLTGMAAGEAGPGLILAFAANGVIALMVGCCYAELGAMLPKAGGAYVWARPALGHMTGFFAGWISWFAQTMACALYALGFGSFASTLLAPVFGENGAPGWLPTALAVFIALVVLMVNYIGSRTAGTAEIVVTGLKIALLMVMVVFGLRTIFEGNEVVAAYEPFLPHGWLGVIGAMGLTFIAFEGYEIIVQTGEEAYQPEKTIPRAIFISILAAVTIYILVAVVMLGAVQAPAGIEVYEHLGKLGELGVAEASGQFVPHGRLLLLFAGLASTVSALNATLYSSARIAFAMGRGGDLPAKLGRVHSKHHTPYAAILVTCGVMILMITSLELKEVAVSADIMFLMLYFLVCVTVIVLRRKWPERERPFRIPFYPIPPIIGIVSGLGLAVVLVRISLTAWLTVGLWLLTGLIFYIAWHRRPATGTEET